MRFRVSCPWWNALWLSDRPQQRVSTAYNVFNYLVALAQSHRSHSAVAPGPNSYDTASAHSVVGSMIFLVILGNVTTISSDSKNYYAISLYSLRAPSNLQVSTASFFAKVSKGLLSSSVTVWSKMSQASHNTRINFFLCQIWMFTAAVIDAFLWWCLSMDQLSTLNSQ